MTVRPEPNSMDAGDRKQLATACGLLASVLTLGAIGFATLLASPETFTWRERALSDLGRLGAETFWLFNGGLIVGGALGVPFAWRLWVASETRIERAGVALLAVATLGLLGVGVFFLEHTTIYLETDLHIPAAVVFFLAAPIAQWVYGTGLVLADDRESGPKPALTHTAAGIPTRTTVGLVSIWLGIVHPVSWLLWFGSRWGAADQRAWFAVPELAAAVAFGGWVLVVASWLWRHPNAGSDSGRL